MESASSQPSGSSQPATGASKFLANLPSRGFLSSTVVSSNLGGMRVYVCDHDTSPPEGQQIKTNQTNILIRSLQLKGQNGNTAPKDVKGASATEGSRKRAPERPVDGRASAKRNNNQNCLTQDSAEVSQSSTSTNDLRTLTVERLRALLKERGLSLRGRKDELVARLTSVDG